MYERNYIEKLVHENFSSTEQEQFKTVLEDKNIASKAIDKIADFLIEKIFYIGSKIVFEKSLLESKGEIEKWDKYKNIVGSLEKLKKNLPNTYSKYIMIVNTALINIKSRSKQFNLGFRFNNLLMMYTYSSISIAISNAISLLIAEDITNRKSFKSKANLAKPSKYITESGLFDTLEKFNKNASSGDFDKYLKIIKSESTGYSKKTIIKPTKEDFVGPIGILAGIAIIIGVLSSIRWLMFHVYNMRTEFSAYLELQAEYLKENEVSIKSNKNFTPYEKNNIIVSQRKWRDRLLYLSDIVKVSDIQTTKQTNIDVEKADKEITYQKITSTTNASELKNSEGINLL